MTVMTSSQEHPKLENRNSKIGRCPSNLESRISSSALKLTLLLTLVSGLWGPQHLAFGTERVWEKSFELPPGGHVSVVNVQGSVLVEGWDRAEVEATVAMRSEAPTDQLDDVRVAVEARRDGVAFHTLYPSSLDTPIHNLHGDIEGINVSGSVVAHALTGNILISLHALPERRLPLQLATINGNVDLVMPAQANADLELSTVAGNIVGDYPFQVSSTPGDSTRHAQVGAGGVRVELRTVRGNIRVSQRDEDL